MLINHKLFLSTFILSVSIAQSAFSSGANDDKTNIQKPDKTLSVSALILTDRAKISYNENKKLEFLNNGLPKKYKTLNPDDALNAEAIKKICFPSVEVTPNRSNFIAPVIAFLAPKLIGLFVKEVDKGIEKEIAKYSKTHKKNVSIRPYLKSDNFELKSPCFRYSRFTEKQYIETSEKVRKVVSKRDLEFDFIGQWKIHEGQHIRMRPLRLFVKSPNVPQDAKKVSLAISAKVDAVWRSDNEGKTGEVFNTIILTEKLNKPEDGNESWTNGLKYYNISENKTQKVERLQPNGNTSITEVIETDGNGVPLKVIREDLNSNKSWASFPALPIIPYSKDNEPETAIASLEISVAEVGDGARKKILKLAKKSLSLFEDDITSVLEEAAEELLEDEAPVVDTPDKYCATFTSILSEDGTLQGSAEWTGGNETCE